MFTYNRPPNSYRERVYYTHDPYTPFTHESPSTYTHIHERGSLAQSRGTLPVTQPTGTLEQVVARPRGPYGYPPTTVRQGKPLFISQMSGNSPDNKGNVGIVCRVLDGEDWLGRSFESQVLNPILNICKRSFRKCFWTLAMLVSISGMIASIYSLVHNVCALRHARSAITFFTCAFFFSTWSCLLMIFFSAFTHCKDAEPEVLSWMWNQLTSLCKEIKRAVCSFWGCVLPTGHRMILWAGVGSPDLSQWFGNQSIRLGRIMTGDIEATTVNTDTQIDPLETTTTKQATPARQRSSAVAPSKRSTPDRQRSSGVAPSSRSTPAMTATTRTPNTTVKPPPTSACSATMTRRMATSTGPEPAITTTRTRTTRRPMKVRIISINVPESCHVPYIYMYTGWSCRSTLNLKI